MTFWTHLLRLSFTLCWLFTLGYSKPAAAIEGRETQFIAPNVGTPQPSFTINNTQRPCSLLDESLESTEFNSVVSIEENTTTAQLSKAHIESVNKQEQQAPHPPDHTLEAVFSRSANYVQSENSEALVSFSTEIENAENNTNELSDISVEVEAPEAIPDAIPDAIPLESLAPSSTQFQFNGQPLNHLTDLEVEAGYRSGSDVNSAALLRGTISLGNSLQRSVTDDQRLTIEHNGTYFQSETVTQSRTVSVTKTVPIAIDGFSIQLSLTAACLNPQETPEEHCTYTPALRTSEADDILDFRQVGRLQTEGMVGDVVMAESLDAIAQPGFQRGTNGQAIGLDLLFPNTGSRLVESPSTDFTINRTETSSIVPIFTLARRRQIVQLNDQAAALGITMRGNSVVVGDDSNLLNVLLQVAAELLPDVVPQVAATHRPANTQVNRNLLLAANNVRLPQRGLTLYHGGISRAASVSEEALPNEVPAANFWGVWLGFSPVNTYHISTRSQDQVLGTLRLISTTGTEGRADGNDHLQFLSSVNGDEFIADNLSDTYVQIYQSFYETTGQTTEIERYTERTAYHPHIRVTGNTTAADAAFNYYVGAIIHNRFNLYAGLDYTATDSQGMTYELGGIFYTQPDRDYYSQLSGSITQQILLSEQASLSLSGGFNWALDRSNQIGDVEVNSRSSAVYLRANAQLNRLSLGASGTLGGILPNAAQNSLRLESSIAISDALTLSGFMMPFSESSSYARYGTSLNWRMGGGPVLKLGWRNHRYGYGHDAFGRELSSDEDLLTFTLEL
ncbi:MAG: hypothetical protein AAFY33_03910 [Cyanobacteria bacterium J06643_4]